MRAISLWRPWSYGFIHLDKTVENRPKCWNVDAWESRDVCFQDAQKFDEAGLLMIQRRARDLGRPMPPGEPTMYPAGVLSFVGTVVAACELEDAVKRAEAGNALFEPFWMFGPACMAVTNIRPFRKAIPWRGKQGWFNVPDSVVLDGIAPTATAHGSAPTNEVSDNEMETTMTDDTRTASGSPSYASQGMTAAAIVALVTAALRDLKAKLWWRERVCGDPRTPWLDELAWWVDAAMRLSRAAILTEATPKADEPAKPVSGEASFSSLVGSSPGCAEKHRGEEASSTSSEPVSGEASQTDAAKRSQEPSVPSSARPCIYRFDGSPTATCITHDGVASAAEVQETYRAAGTLPCFKPPSSQASVPLTREALARIVYEKMGWDPDFFNDGSSRVPVLQAFTIADAVLSALEKGTA